MKIYILTGFLIILLLNGFTGACQVSVNAPAWVRKPVYADVSPPLRDMTVIPVPDNPSGLVAEEKEVWNFTNFYDLIHLNTDRKPLGIDPVLQNQYGDVSTLALTPIQNFEAINNISGVYPPDTQGDVSSDFYVQNVNLSFAIYYKNGTLAYGPALLASIWEGIPNPWYATSNGDPVVFYDQAADRWVITQFSLPNNTQYAMLIAVSRTNDPTGSWYRYVYQYGNMMPDYPKFGVWPDGYYMSANQFLSGSTYSGTCATAFERNKMLTGDPTAQMIYFNVSSSGYFRAMLPSDWDGTTPPVAGEPNYFVYFDNWTSSPNCYLKVWQFHANWDVPSSSTFSEVYSLQTAPFTAPVCSAYRGQCIPQPGTTVKLESLSDRLMYRLQYRNFGDHRSMVTNHTVDVDGTNHAGIRWYELRNTGSGWTIYQQGTYAPDASHRWVGSIAMNGNGDMALGYSLSNSTTIYPSIRYTGRYASDPLGVMTIAEQGIINGSGYQSGSAARWGDYSMMSVDPTDDLTFWFTTEYIQNTGGAPWQTRVASFLFSNVAPVANFVSNNTFPLPGTTVTLSDISTGAPTTWNWTFSPNTVTYMGGTNSTSKNPQVQFNANGVYAVTLQATNAYGSNSKTRTAYEHVGTQGLWTGASSTDWSNNLNWSNATVPDSTVSVTIPASATNWPVYNGNLTIRTHCLNLNMAGSSQLTVNGNLTIKQGSAVTVAGSGLIRVSGDWTDYGGFSAGTGTVEFFGAAPAKITGGINKNTLLSNYVRSTFTKGMTALTGASAGPTVADGSLTVPVGFTFNYLGIDYTTTRLNADGWLAPNLTGTTTTYDNTQLFTTSAPNTTLAPWWDRLKPDATGIISYKTEGSAPNRIFTAEWNNVLVYYTTATARFNFQVKLYETTNVIEFQYGNLVAGTYSGSESASIGIEDETGSIYHFIEATTGSMITGKYNLKPSTGWPAVNYRFTPPYARETFNNLTNSKTGVTLTIQPDITVLGNLVMTP